MDIVTEPFPSAPRSRPTATRFGVAIAISLAAHALALYELPALERLRPGIPEPETHALTVRLAPLPAPPALEMPAQLERPRPLVRRSPRAAPEVREPRPLPPSPAAEPVIATAPASRPAEPDLMAYVEARRRARAAPANEAAPAPPPRPQEDENARASRAAAANLASTRPQVFGYDPDKSGGVFMIEQLGSGYATFTFTGWNPDARRHTKQLVEVRAPAGADIRLAVVRKVISIIRAYEPEEFSWDSQRLDRTLMLSSRPRDNAGLEDFMMLEFFSGPKPLYRDAGG